MLARWLMLVSLSSGLDIVIRTSVWIHWIQTSTELHCVCDDSCRFIMVVLVLLWSSYPSVSAAGPRSPSFRRLRLSFLRRTPRPSSAASARKAWSSSLCSALKTRRGRSDPISRRWCVFDGDCAECDVFHSSCRGSRCVSVCVCESVCVWVCVSC